MLLGSNDTVGEEDEGAAAPGGANSPLPSVEMFCCPQVLSVCDCPPAGRDQDGAFFGCDCSPERVPVPLDWAPTRDHADRVVQRGWDCISCGRFIAWDQFCNDAAFEISHEYLQSLGVCPVHSSRAQFIGRCTSQSADLPVRILVTREFMCGCAISAESSQGGSAQNNAATMETQPPVQASEVPQISCGLCGAINYSDREFWCCDMRWLANGTGTSDLSRPRTERGGRAHSDLIAQWDVSSNLEWPFPSRARSVSWFPPDVVGETFSNVFCPFLYYVVGLLAPDAELAWLADPRSSSWWESCAETFRQGPRVRSVDELVARMYTTSSFITWGAFSSVENAVMTAWAQYAAERQVQEMTLREALLLVLHCTSSGRDSYFDAAMQETLLVWSGEDLSFQITQHAFRFQSRSREAQPPAQPAARPAVQQVLQPAAQPAVHPAVQPAAQPVVQPVVQPAQQLAGLAAAREGRHASPATGANQGDEPEAQPAGPPAVQPAAQPAVQPAVPPAVQPAVQPATYFINLDY